MTSLERSPMWKTKDMKLDETIRITIESPKAIASGNSKFGLWELWAIVVTNQKVWKNNEEIDNYTGRAVMFPSVKLREKFLEMTNGCNENVVVELVKRAKTNDKGNLYTSYDVKLIDSGKQTSVNNNSNPFMVNNISDDSLNSVEEKLVKDATDAKKQLEVSGGVFTKEQFIQCAETSFNVKKERAEKIFDKYMK